MSRWRLNPEDGAVKVTFTNTTYEPYANLRIPHGVWGYGIRQTKMVLEKVPAAFTQEKLFKATTNDTALLLVGNMQIVGTCKGELKVNKETVFQMDSAPVHDGLIAARGRVYAATKGGKVYCLGKSE